VNLKNSKYLRRIYPLSRLTELDKIEKKDIILSDFQILFRMTAALLFVFSIYFFNLIFSLSLICGFSLALCDIFIYNKYIKQYVQKYEYLFLVKGLTTNIILLLYFFFGQYISNSSYLDLVNIGIFIVKLLDLAINLYSYFLELK
jgi:hypothetical protein